MSWYPGLGVRAAQVQAPASALAICVPLQKGLCFSEPQFVQLQMGCLKVGVASSKETAAVLGKLKLYKLTAEAGSRGVPRVSSLSTLNTARGRPAQAPLAVSSPGSS